MLECVKSIEENYIPKKRLNYCVEEKLLLEKEHNKVVLPDKFLIHRARGKLFG
jgi:hypothetical protein